MRSGGRERERERERDEQRQQRNTSNEDEQQRESVTEDEPWLIDGSDKGEDECLTLTTLIIRPAHNTLPILTTQWHHRSLLWVGWGGTLGVGVAAATGSPPAVARRQSPWRCIWWGWEKERMEKGSKGRLWKCERVCVRVPLLKAFFKLR